MKGTLVVGDRVVGMGAVRLQVSSFRLQVSVLMAELMEK